MIDQLPKPFPPVATNESDDYNPGIRLFGKRFMKEQTVVEYLAEFLAVVASPKRLAGNEVNTPLPEMDVLKNWPPGVNLEYKPSIKLNLKLFAFMGNTPLDSKVRVHEEQYKKLLEIMVDNIKVDSYSEKAEDIVQHLEEFVSGFHGEGHNRTWCTQNFFPLDKDFITQETIWNFSEAKKEGVNSWKESIDRLNKFYSVSKHRFMARGGEVLFLQICNLMAQDEQDIKKFADGLMDSDSGLFTPEEYNLADLHQALQNGLTKLDNDYIAPLKQMVDYIEKLDEETHNMLMDRTAYNNCKWCPQESWPEGFLFAVELKRLFEAVLDPLERIELLMTGCVLQVLRSVSAQSARFLENNNVQLNNPLNYAWLFSPLHSATRQQRAASRVNLNTNLGRIQKVLRNNALVENAKNSTQKGDIYKEADNRYGHKLFLALGKKMGMIVPYTGPNARFVLTDQMLRYLVMTLIRPGESCRYDVFLQRVYVHYGIALEGEQLAEAAEWSGLLQNSNIQAPRSWLTEMLLAGGFLIELSDDISIVHNSFK